MHGMLVAVLISKHDHIIFCTVETLKIPTVPVPVFTSYRSSHMTTVLGFQINRELKWSYSRYLARPRSTLKIVLGEFLCHVQKTSELVFSGFLWNPSSTVPVLTGGLIQDFRQMDRHSLSGVLKKTYHVTHRCKRLK